MKTDYLFILPALVFALLLNGCMAQKSFDLQDQKIMIEQDKLYLDGQLYAELRYWGTIEHDQHHSAIAIYYYQDNIEEWIFPKTGIGYYVIEENRLYSTTTEMKELERTASENGLRIIDSRTGKNIFDREKIYVLAGKIKFEPYEKAAPYARVYDVQFSKDGKYVLFQQEGPWPNSRSYRVKYGECFERDLGAPRRR